MRIFIIFFFLLFFLSCNPENKITRRIIRHDKKLDEIASYFLSRYNKETILNNTEIEDPQIARFLRNKMGTPFVHIVYDTAKYFIDADSVIMFTRSGFPVFGYEHDVIIDFKQIPRNGFSGPFEVVKKVTDRKFNGKAPMPVF